MIYITNSSISSRKANLQQSIEVCNSFSKYTKIEFWYPLGFSKNHKNPIINEISSKSSFEFNPTYCINSECLKKYFPSLGFYVKEISFIIGIIIKIIFFNKDKTIYTRHVNGFLFLNILKKFRLTPNKIYIEIHAINKQTHKLKNFDGYIALNEEIEKILKINQFKNVITGHDGVNLDVFNPISKSKARVKVNLSEQNKYCIYSGKYKTLGKEKGIPEIIQSIKYITSKNVYFLFVGGDPGEKEVYIKMAKNTNIDIEKLIFIEHVNQKTLKYYLSASDVFLMPFPREKHYELYMSPLKMFEYMAMKRPIVTTDLKSIAKILDKKNSFVSEPGDIEGLAKNIDYALSKESKLKAENAFKKVKDFTWDKRAKKIFNLINE